MEIERSPSSTTLVNAFNYAIGRMTYAVQPTAEDIRFFAKQGLFATSELTFMIDEINRRWGIGALGMKPDTEQWLETLEVLKTVRGQDV